MPKTWQEKLHTNHGLPKVEVVEKSMLGIEKGQKMVIVPPVEYDEQMKKVGFGEVVTVPELRTYFAKKYHADAACPLTAGIFVNIVAHAAEEASANGEKDTTPWWRTVKGEGELNEKYPGGAEEQGRRLVAEGRKLIKKGKKLFVEL